MNERHSAYIHRISKFLPGPPVENDEMEDYLGKIGGQRSRAKAIVLRNNRIRTRHYARDRAGRSTHTNAQLTALAVQALMDKDPALGPAIDLLACGTTTPDQLLPAHGNMVLGELKGKPMETVTLAGSCLAGISAFKYACLAVSAGSARQAVVAASERFSSWLGAQTFDEEASRLAALNANPGIAFEKEFLRWMLSDGAAAVSLRPHAARDGLSLQVDWIEMHSFAGEVDACMYAGARKTAQGALEGWADLTPQDWLDESIFALKQDARLLEQHIARLGTLQYVRDLARHEVDPRSLDWFLPHISSDYFRSRVDDEMRKHGVDLPQERWFVNLSTVGNVGAASIFLALEELMASGRLAAGQTLMLAIPESARFSYAHAMLTVVAPT